MKICVAQTTSIKGDIESNVEKHKKLITLAVSYNSDIIIFPELSLTGYEPELAKKLATDINDNRFDAFQQISDAKKIIIGAGIPTNGHKGIHITMLLFQPGKERQAYSKQFLHEDEFPFFVGGGDQVYLNVSDTKVAPAICYESLLPHHSENAFNNGANIYIASVAKSAAGVEKAFKHFPVIAEKYSMTVLMSNCIGYCDNFESAGKTAAWNNKGVLLSQLNDKDEGILIIDTDTEEIVEKYC